MTGLIIDTSTERGFIALLEEETLLFLEELPFGLANASTLFPAIDKGMQGRKPQNLAYIAVGVGPGSYTGMRVAVAAAKSIAFAAKLPLITFSSLQAFIPEQEGTFAAMVDAKIGGVYMMKGKQDGKSVTYLTAPAVITLEALPEQLHDVQQIVTPSAKVLQERLQKNGITIPCEEVSPHAEHLAKIVHHKFLRGETTSQEQIEILYLRNSVAK